MKKTAAARRTKRTPALPLVLQIVAAFVHEQGFTAEGLMRRYAAADAIAKRLIALPFGARGAEDFVNAAEQLVSKDDEHMGEVRAVLIAYFSRPEMMGKVLTPESAADELIGNLLYPNRDAGFELGLCVGVRLARAFAGQDGLR